MERATELRGALERHRQPAHEHTPEPGTVYTSTGLPVTIGEAAPHEHPLDAVCVGCRQPIRRQGEYLADWELK